MASSPWKKPTINQVAERAGVSKTTVSLYLAGKRDICSQATGRRIDRAVADLNYQPNPLAGGAIGRVCHTVGLLAADDLERGNEPWMVHNMRLVNGILQVANASDYSVLTYPFGVYLRREYRTMLDGRVDAVLFYGSSDHEIVQRLVAAGMPVVSFGCPGSEGVVAGSAHLDEDAVSVLAMDHLWSLGHRRIAHLAGPYADCHRLEYDPEHGWLRRLERAEPVSKARMEAAMQFLKDRDAFEPRWFSRAHAWKNAEVVPTLEEWWQGSPRPTAIYCANDYIAWEAIGWARANGIGIPTELAIVGVDNVEGPDRELFLTSVDIEVEEIGRQAMRAVLGILNESEAGVQHRRVSPRALAVRASTIGQLASNDRAPRAAPPFSKRL